MDSRGKSLQELTVLIVARVSLLRRLGLTVSTSDLLK